MDRHVTARDLLAFADDELEQEQGAAVAAHLETCADCQRRFADQCAVDAALAGPTPERAAMRHSAERALRAPAPRRRAWSLGLLAAATVLLAAAFWLRAGDATAVVVHRERLANTVRGTAEERLHLDVTVTAPAWLAVFARDVHGSVQRLLPHPDPNLGSLGVDQPLQPGGAVRVPGAELFDFGIEPETAPRELVLVIGARAWDEAALAGLLAELRGAAPGTLPAAVRAGYPRSRIATVPQ